MTIVKEMLLRQAIELSAIIGDHSETLKNLTVSFMKSEFGMEFQNDEIERAIYQEQTARLFFACGKSKPEDIRNPRCCLRLARDLWLNYSVAVLNQLTAEHFIKEAEERFHKEKEINSTLEMRQSPLLNTIKKIFSKPEIAQEFKEYLQKTIRYFQVAFYVLDGYFASSTAKTLFDLYNPFFEPIRETSVAETNSSDELTEHKNKSNIRYLEKSIHDLKVKLEYAQKDATRNVVMTLASIGFGSPIFELYAIKKDETTPEHISSAISNLLLALESLDIHIFKENLVGKTMIFDEIEEGTFCLQNDEVLEASDSVVIKYPGVKLGKEIIVKPTIAKEI